MTPQAPSRSEDREFMVFFCGGAIGGAIGGVIGGVSGINVIGVVAASGGGGFIDGATVGGNLAGIVCMVSFVVRELLVLLRQRSAARLRASANSSGNHPCVPLGWWRALCVVSWGMPANGGRRWLGEAESFLFEVSAEGQQAALRSLVLSAPEAAAVMWWGELSRRTRLAVSDRDSLGRGKG